MRWLALAIALGGAAGCASEPACDVPPGCDPGLVCEQIAGRDRPRCLPPVVVQGTVRDNTTGSTVAGARVVAVGLDGEPLAAAATTGADGSYEIQVAAPRDATLAPQSKKLQLRVWAPGYGAFPHPWQTWPIVDLAGARASQAGDKRVLASTDTDAALLAFTGGPGTGSLCGVAELASRGAPPLVVAEYAGDPARPTGVAELSDASGGYLLFGLPAGEIRLSAYARGASYGERIVDLNTGEATCRDLALDPTPAATVSGTLALPAGSAATPIVALAVASTWDPVTGIGDVPNGLRVSARPDGSFAIEEVPAGRYVVLVSLENDDLVAPDPPPRIEVSGQDVTVADPIRVVPALAVVGPGADGPESVRAAPTLSWQDVEGEASYHVTVANVLGATVFAHDEPAHAGGSPAVPFAGNLVPGSIYRFRVEAHDAQGHVISRTEELRGIFYFIP